MFIVNYLESNLATKDGHANLNDMHHDIFFN